MDQNISSAFYKKLRPKVDELRSGAVAKAPEVMEDIIEMAKKDNLPLLVESCKAAQGGSEAFLRSYNSMLDVITNYLETQRKRMRKLGHDV